MHRTRKHFVTSALVAGLALTSLAACHPTAVVPNYTYATFSAPKKDTTTTTTTTVAPVNNTTTTTAAPVNNTTTTTAAPINNTTTTTAAPVTNIDGQQHAADQRAQRLPPGGR